jgi:hypothetical protein
VNKLKETKENVIYKLITSFCICVSLRLLIKDSVMYVLSCFGASLVLAFVSAYIEFKDGKK